MNQLSLFSPSKPVFARLPRVEWESPESVAFRALPVEHLRLMHNRLPQGCPLCETRLVRSADGWHWSIGYLIFGEPTQGQAGPVDQARAAPTRTDALALAVADLEASLGRYEASNRDAKAALYWARAQQ